MSDTEQGADAEQAAVSLLRAGSVSGLEVLVCLHQARALRAAYAITHSQAAAEDVVAEAFLRAFERIGGFDPKRPFGPWFLRIVVNLSIKEADRSYVLDRLRLKRASIEPEPPVDPAGAVEALEQAMLLRRAIRELSPRLRAALVLHYFLEFDVAETASVLNCPVGTVKRRLHDARRKLEVAIGPDLDMVVSRQEKQRK